MRILLALLRVSRPYYVIQAVAPPVAGYVTACESGLAWSNVFIIATVYSLLGISAWSSDELSDIDSGRRAKTKKIWRLYVSGGTDILNHHSLPRGVVAAFVLLTMLVGLIMASQVSASFFVLSAVSILVGLSYSIPPLKLKERGIFGASVTAITYGLIGFSAGWLASEQQFTYLPLTFGLLMSAVVFGFDGLGHLIDYKDDRSIDLNTFVVKLGLEKSRKLLAILQVLPLLLISTLGLFKYLHVNLLLIVLLLLVSIAFASLTRLTSDEETFLALRILSVPIIATSFFILL